MVFLCLIMICIVVLLRFVIIFFFFKQKTAYEMRISDWSSDVCSSDLRAGLRYVCISSRLTQNETDYILDNSGARILVVSASLAGAAQQLQTGIKRFAMGGETPGYESWEDAVAAMPATPVADERAGVDMHYS